jgi:peptide-methionine (R)-S-oxide reductase
MLVYHPQNLMKRRQTLILLGNLAAAALAARLVQAAPPASSSTNKIQKLIKDKQAWGKLLPAAAYAVLFEHGTERAGTSSLNGEKRAGTYVCAACYLPLFLHTQKFDSGTGWPSFYDALPNALETKSDYKLILPRTEYHCARCEGHQGHVFNDGPKPTGLRYCNNGVALKFVAVDEKLPSLRS